MYCLDPNAAEPIMLLDQPIGMDSDFPNDPFIDGSLFAKEMMYLDSMGKTTINVWIASGGGSVLDGMKIYNAILQTKAKVNTHIIFAASIAAVISQAGRERTMADFGKLMFHNPSGGDDKGLAAIKDSIITMVEKRSKLSYQDISKMMSRTTWIGADEALALGLCDTIEHSSDLNKPRMIGAVTEMVNVAKLYVNNALKKTNNKMNEVALSLGLAEDATQEQIAAAISELKSTKESVPATAQATTEASAEATIEISSLNEILTTLQAELDAIKNASKEAEVTAAKEKATTLVNKFTNKLGNAAEEVKLTWINKAIENYSETESMLEALPVNFKGSNIENKAAEVDVPTSALYLAAKVKNELKKQGRRVFLA